jgi:hypothetical protein
MAKTGFNSIVAARTRAARQILETPDLLAKFIALGGLSRDLETIIRFGEGAEAASLGQSQSVSLGKSATVSILSAFAALQREYSSVMAVVSAVKTEKELMGGESELVAKLEQILVNEAELSVKITVEKTDEEGEGKKKRTVRRSAGQEALRAEIAKDAAALIALDEAEAALSERMVTKERLTALRNAADSLAGLLAKRSTVKGAAKTATKSEYDSSALQRKVWGGTYRILNALGQKDERVRSLLKEAKAK